MTNNGVVSLIMYELNESKVIVIELLNKYFIQQLPATSSFISLLLLLWLSYVFCVPVVIVPKVL